VFGSLTLILPLRLPSFHLEIPAVFHYMMRMQNQVQPALPKWPFLIGDACMLGAAWFVYFQSKFPMGAWQIFFVILCVAGGAVLGIMPFLLEYRVSVRLVELEGLSNAVSQIKDVERLAAQITSATGQWTAVQEQAEKTSAASKELVERMTAEARSFSEFIQKASDSEKSALRLEVEKLRRAEADWLQVLVRTLDHVYALHQGGLRSGQPRLMEQLSAFQNACREAARRVGVTPFTPEPSEPFDPQRHQPMEGNGEPVPGAPIQETLAAGYNFQGKLIRPALVRVNGSQAHGAGVAGNRNNSDENQRDLPLDEPATA
jgi:molecular chaperone GrpE (heat shock protein)